jgi:hypothetical protein
MRGRCNNAIDLSLASAQTGLAVELIPVFDFQFIDTSLEGATNGPCADAQVRLATPALGGRDWSLALEGAARFTITGWAQVSNLIRYVKIVESDADSGHVIEGDSVGRRGQNDRSRSRTFDGLLRDDLLVQGLGVF